MGTMALRYSWLIAHPEITSQISDFSTLSILQKTLRIAAPLEYWSAALAFVGVFQLFSLTRDLFIGRESIPLRKKSCSAAWITWGLISYSYFNSSQPAILSLTFMLFCGFCLFLLLLLHRKERFVHSLPEGEKNG